MAALLPCGKRAYPEETVGDEKTFKIYDRACCEDNCPNKGNLFERRKGNRFCRTFLPPSRRFVFSCLCRVHEPMRMRRFGDRFDLASASHSRPISKVADLDSRSGLSRGPDGLVVGFRRFGIAR